tara:strand:+ start:2799 stop:4577 length:1779 start_codon:yes stop_codon:yes gene_type:complete
MESPSIGKNLIYQRKLKGLTQADLSEKTQVTVRTIQRIEKGEVEPHLQTVKLLAAALNVEVDDLLILENPKEEAVVKKWLLLIHGTSILGTILPLCNILFPLFLWIHKREDNKVYDEHGVKVINFQITMTLLFALSFIALVTVEGFGFFLFIAVLPFTMVVMIYNIIRAIKTQTCYYPLSIPFLKSGKKVQKSAVIVLFSVISLLNFGTIQAQQINRLDGSSITTDLLSAKIEQLTKAAHVTGIEVTVFNDNEIAFAKAFGYSNKENNSILKTDGVIYGASLSKAVFGYLVAGLADEGVVDLDKPLQEYLDVPIPQMKLAKEWREFHDLANDDRYKKITARMCLSHSTGLPNWRWISKKGKFKPKGKLKFYSDPGTNYSYSGEGMMLLQYVIEHITGKGLEELARERVFDPLKMDMTSYLWQTRFEDKYVYGHTKDEKVVAKDVADESAAAGSMVTTADDYAKFIKHILELNTANSEITKLMFQPNIYIHSKAQFGPSASKTSNENDDIKLSYGLGWGLLDSPFGQGAFKEGHGEGFQHYSIIFPEQKMGVVILSNSDNAESIFKELLEFTIADTFTPWKWEGYIPYDAVEQ